MKRFWTTAATAATAAGVAIRLDGRPVRTPGGRPLILPNQPLAEAVAAEWQAIETHVRAHAMPLTGIANAAIDLVGDDRSGFAAGLARYAGSDLLCYRAEGPAALVARQEAAWDPLLGWARARFGIDFCVTRGVVPVAQPPGTAERIAAALAAMPPFALAAMALLVTLSGSAILPLALAEGRIDADAAWDAATLDERFQTEQWGADAEALAALADRRQQFAAAARGLALTQGNGQGRESNDAEGA